MLHLAPDSNASIIRSDNSVGIFLWAKKSDKLVTATIVIVSFVLALIIA